MKIEIIGQGNVGSHLAKAFRDAGHDVNNISSRSLDKHRNDADLYLIAVKDDLVESVAERLDIRNKVIAHTSGSIPVSALQKISLHSGVLYPCQTFTKGNKMIYGTIPFLIEAGDPKTRDILTEAARSISDNVDYADSEKRKIIHIAAIFAANFTNHLWHLAHQILSENNIPFHTLIPLIQQSVDKIKITSPYLAQTGPAVRNDTEIIASHMKILEQNPEMKNIYKLLTESITKTHFNNDECN